MDPTISANDSSTVRFYIGVDEEAAELLGYLETLPRTERVAVLHAAVPVWRKIMASTYGPHLRRHFERPPTVEEYALQDKDFRAALGRVAASGATTLIVLGYGFEYPGLFKQMEELGLRRSLARVVGGWGFLYAPLSPAQLEGVIVAGPQYVLGRAAAADSFAAAFEAVAKRPANFDAAFAYELVRTLPELRASGALTDSTIKRGVHALGRREGVVGTYRFTPRGDMIVETGLGVYRSGRLQPYRGQ
jgi:ABC-type branched-subunit amino acid transport system substrate-binding protein